jgi:ATP-dependent Clp protease ATP-binding subunit ClpC
MFKDFTDRAKKVIVLAQEEAKELKHLYTGTEHILLGLIREGEGTAAKILAAKGVTLELVRNLIIETIGIGTASTVAQTSLTPRTKKVLDLALHEALDLGKGFVGTEHLLLGIIREGEGVAAQILMRLDID